MQSERFCWNNLVLVEICKNVVTVNRTKFEPTEFCKTIPNCPACYDPNFSFWLKLNLVKEVTAGLCAQCSIAYYINIRLPAYAEMAARSLSVLFAYSKHGWKQGSLCNVPKSGEPHGRYEYITGMNAQVFFSSEMQAGTIFPLKV